MQAVMALINRYSFSQFMIFTVILVLAFKSFVTFLEWLYQRAGKLFQSKLSETNQKKAMEQRLAKGSEIMHQLQQTQKDTDVTLTDLSAKINLLIKSDKDDIKSYITREHHYFCYRLGWIDDFSLQCIEKRYDQYLRYNGNSFIRNFMEELRNLPKQPPASIDKAEPFKNLPDLIRQEKDYQQGK